MSPDLVEVEVVDRRAGLIRVRGPLTSLGADLLRGTADGLRGSGPPRVVLDMRGVRGADLGALDILREMRDEFAAEGGQLVVRT
ncbi:STAS domain-containing protein [Geodermatophilus marinus]|uniref:STAS domain-containing protein n=1 Tax=Geodermatophilus sp. LHW52908 TaxID=2303986 RepID=UPI000E3EA836|nr:STAS domain-containing protein [Geodermatophilus sp. LHW52908]RFU21347.1 STAS domain-containing protein [Geodermatophilus sp. LHW52908]